MKIVFIFLMISILSACQAWSPSIQRLKEQCGADWSDAQQRSRILQLIRPDGDPLTAAESEAVRVQFDGAGQRQALPISAKGCVAVPEGDGTLVAQNSLRSWALAEPLQSSKFWLNGFQTLRFNEPKTWQVELVCPEGGWLVNDRLDSVLSFQGDFNPQLVELQILVKNAREETFRLASKQMGFGLDGSLQGFDLRSLAEGTYQLQLNVRDLSKDWNPDVITQFRSCPLQIIRHVPELKQSSLPDQHIHSLDAILTPEFQEPSDRLFVCKESGYRPAGTEGCQAQSTCIHDDAFKEQTVIRLDERGAWTYYYFGKNRLGQRSRNSCMPVYVSDSAPDVAVQWKKSAWNESLVLEKALPPDLEAVVDVKPGILSREELEKHLSCKVDFIFRGESVFPGSKVICLSQSCRGRPMNDFVPCDAQLRFTVSEALQTEFLRDSEVRLTVKAEDGAGHETERTTSLWLHDSQHRTLDFMRSGPEDLAFNDYPATFWFTNDGGFLVQTGRFFESIKFHYLQRFMDWGYTNAWKNNNETSMPGKPTMASAVQTSDGRLYAIYPTYESGEGISIFRRFFAEFSEGQWNEKTIEGWDPLNEKCDELILEFDGRVLCHNLSELIVIDPNKGTLVRSNIPEDIVKKPCPFGVPKIVSTPKRYLYAFCNDGGVLMRDPNGVWQGFSLPRTYRPTLDSIVFDAGGRLWVQATEYNVQPIIDYLLMIDGTKVEEITLPTDVPAFEISPSWKPFALDGEGRPRYADRRWNATSQTWETIPELREWLGAGPMRVSAVKGTLGGLWYETTKFMLFLHGKERQLFPLKSLNWSSPDYPSAAALGPKNQLCFIFRSQSSMDNVRCQIDKIWSRVGRNYLNLPKDKIVYTHRSSAGEPLVATAHEGAFVWQGSAWKNLAPPAPKPFETFHCHYFYADGVLYYRYNREIYRFGPNDKDWALVFTFKDYDYFGDGWGDSAFKDYVGNIWFKLDGGGIIRFDGQEWKLLLLPSDLVPMDVLAFEKKLLVIAKVLDGPNHEATHQALFWVDPKTFEATPMDPVKEFGWDSELLQNMDPNLGSLFDSEAFILTSQIDLRLKSVIFDLRTKEQTVIDSYKRLWNQRIMSFSRIDDDHYMINFNTLLGGSIGPNQDFRIISSGGQNTLLFTTFEMKQVEENFNLSPSYYYWYIDDQKRIWTPAGTFQQDISDELFRIDLKPWLL